ncbi:TPA: hypothetical protein U0J99_002040 [Streptococcus suis]|nr:hypothetical protein [Streptococcus suis]
MEYLKKIDSEWKLDAKDENIQYFYHTEETESILNGKSNMIIGRKGEGKTAIATFIHKNVGAGAFAEKLSFKNFSFNLAYSYGDSRYSRPSQYTTFWKYLIYVSLCKQMIKDEKVDVEIRNKLEKLFPNSKITRKLGTFIPQITLKEFGMQVLGNGFNIGLDISKEDVEWTDLVEVFEEVICNNISIDSKYYVIFDELDEDYKDFTSKEEEQDYFALVTSLFKAVSETRNYFRELELPIFPIVFLRTDIYQRITYSDKNKWDDYLINLGWTQDKLRKLIQHRIDVLTGRANGNFQEAWERVVLPQDIQIGNRQSRRIKPIDYILRSTHNRPRDIIKYLKEASKVAIKNNHNLIGANDIKKANDKFSEYLKQEIIDEIYSVLPEYEDIFAILSTIRKQTFSPQEFVDIYQDKVFNENLKNRGAETVLKILFDFSIIGNVPSMQNQQIFKYSNDSARFNFREKIIIHRGLYKALQIF